MPKTASDHCAIIDSDIDIDYAAGRITYAVVDTLTAEITACGLTQGLDPRDLRARLASERGPHIHQKLGCKIGVGAKIMVVQETFGKIFNEGTEFQRDGSQFDVLFKGWRHVHDRVIAGLCHVYPRAYVCPAWIMSSAMPLLPVILCLCPMAVLRAATFREATQAGCMTASKRC